MAGGPSDDSVMRWVRVILLVVATTGGGFGVSQGVDLFNAKAWQDANVQKLLEAERMQDRLLQCRAKTDAYEKQNEMLIALVARLQDDHDGIARGHGASVEPPHTLPPLPDLE